MKVYYPPMPKILRKYITVDKEILGGTPVVSGTRIPLERLYQLIKQGQSIEKLQEEYPWVDKKKLQYTLAALIKFSLDEIEKTQKV